MILSNVSVGAGACRTIKCKATLFHISGNDPFAFWNGPLECVLFTRTFILPFFYRERAW